MLADVEYIRILDDHGNGISSGIGNSMELGIRPKLGNGNGRELEFKVNFRSSLIRTDRPTLS